MMRITLLLVAILSAQATKPMEPNLRGADTPELGSSNTHRALTQDLSAPPESPNVFRISDSHFFSKYRVKSKAGVKLECPGNSIAIHLKCSSTSDKFYLNQSEEDGSRFFYEQRGKDFFANSGQCVYQHEHTFQKLSTTVTTELYCYSSHLMQYNSDTNLWDCDDNLMSCVTGYVPITNKKWQGQVLGVELTCPDGHPRMLGQYCTKSSGHYDWVDWSRPK